MARIIFVLLKIMLGNLKNLIVRAVGELRAKGRSVQSYSVKTGILEIFSGLKYETISWNVFNVTLIKSTEKPNKT